MTRERAFQPGDETAFDWRGPATAQDISVDVAHALYLRALRSVVEVEQAEALYRRWLRQHIASREAGRVPVPGRQTQVQAGGRVPRFDPWPWHELEGAVPGRVTRALIDLARDEALQPGIDEREVGLDPHGFASDWLTAHPPGRADPRQPSAPGRRSLVTQGAPRRYEDHRVRGVQAVLQRLGPDHPLRQDLLAAVAASERSIAWRAKGWLESLPGSSPDRPSESGAVLWQVAERHAVTIFRRAVRHGEVDVNDPAVSAALDQRRAGQPLAVGLRDDLERTLGVSLADVRIHTDAVAARATRAIGAEAFTVGEDVFFADGAFAPDTGSGRKLLVHELTHVAQNLRAVAAPADRGPRVSEPDDPREREAEAVVRAMEATREAAIRRGPALAIDLTRTFGHAARDIPLLEDAARARGAEAATVGGAVYFAPGLLDPERDEGRLRIGHEVAHALQQRQAAAPPLDRTRRAALEAEAEAAGRAFVGGQPFTVQGRAPAAAALYRGATPNLEDDSDGDARATLGPDVLPAGLAATLPSGPEPHAQGEAGAADAGGGEVHAAGRPVHHDGDAGAHRPGAAAHDGHAAVPAPAGAQHAPAGGPATGPHTGPTTPVPARDAGAGAHGDSATRAAPAHPAPGSGQGSAQGGQAGLADPATHGAGHDTQARAESPHDTAARGHAPARRSPRRGHAAARHAGTGGHATHDLTPGAVKNTASAAPQAAAAAASLRAALRPDLGRMRLKPSATQPRSAPPPRVPHPKIAPPTLAQLPAVAAVAATARAGAHARLEAARAARLGDPPRFVDPPLPPVEQLATPSGDGAQAGPGGPRSAANAATPPNPAERMAQIRTRNARRRQQAETLVAEATQRGQRRIDALASLGAQLPSLITPAVGEAHTVIAQSVARSEQIIRGAVAAAQAQARGATAQATAAVRTGHQAAASTIQASTIAARAVAAAGLVVAKVAVSAQELAQVADVERMYREADVSYRAVGPRVGAEAVRTAHGRASTWRSQFDGQSDWLDGPLHDDRLRARADAAEKVGDGYRTSIIDEGNKQADEGQKGKAKDIDNTRTAARETRSAFDTQHAQAMTALGASETQALTTAQQTADRVLEALGSQLEHVLGSLVQQQSSLLLDTRRSAAQQRKGIEEAGQAAIASTQRGLGDAATGLREALAGLVGGLHGQVTPDPQALATQLRTVLDGIDRGAGQASAAAHTGAEKSAQAVRSQGGQAGQALAQMGQAGADSAHQAAGAFAQSAGQAGASGAQAVGQIGAAHRTQVTTSAGQLVQAFVQQVSHVADLFSQLDRQLQQGFRDSGRGLEQGLRGALANLGADIDKYADQAAAQVQPRWKSILKIVLAIAIVLVVAIVVGPAVIGFVGAAAGALGASAGAASVIGAVVGGAIVGAGAGAVNQLGNNAIDGRPLMEGVGHAAIVGAITGAIGGGAGAWGQALSRGGSALAGVAVRVGGNMVGAFAGQVGADALTGRPIDWRAAGVSALISGGMSLGMEGLGAFARAGAAGQFGRLGNLAGRIGDRISGWQQRAGAYGARGGGFVGGQLRLGIDWARSTFTDNWLPNRYQQIEGDPAANLTDAQGRQHILEGEGAPGDGRGRHRFGGGEPSSYNEQGRFRPKSEFPPEWSDDLILQNASEIATDPNAPRALNYPNPGSGGNRVTYGIRNGVLMQVVVSPTGRIITAYPINTATAIDPVTGQQVVLNSPTPVRANPALPGFPIVAPPTQGGDEHRDRSP